MPLGNLRSDKPAVLIFKSPRGGYNVMRLDEHKDVVNLAKLEGLPNVTFAHKDGFLAAIKADTLDEAIRVTKELIPHAITRPPSATLKI